MKRALASSLLLLLLLPVQAIAQTPPAALAYTSLRDPAEERAARQLMETLRCLVCQGQSIADSDAEMAADMRAMVRKRIAAGEKPEAIRQWLVDRYGDYVTYDPPWSAATIGLWLAPLALLGLGLWLARGSFKRKARG